MSRYATLLSDDSSDSDEDPVPAKGKAKGKGKGKGNHTLTAEAGSKSSSSTAASAAPRQSGGSYAQRSDPITGVDWSNTGAPVDTGFSAEDIEACIRVVTGLGKLKENIYTALKLLNCEVSSRSAIRADKYPCMHY
jgi:hypothetical protein